MPAPNPNYAPATPPATSDGGDSYYTHYTDQGEQPLLRESTASLYSGTRTPRFSRSQTAGGNVSSVIPAISLQNPRNRRRTRSASCSSVNTRESQYHEHHHEQYVGDSQKRATRAPRFRRRSSADTDRGELGVRIPHYRLGTPRFSDRGTAYLHSSVYTNSTIPSSVLSHAEFDKIFPIPPGRGISFLATQSNGQLYVQPTNAHSRSLVARSPYSSNRPSTIGFITPDTFDKIEDNLDNPAFVHYHPTTGRIVAATVSEHFKSCARQLSRIL